MSKMSEMLPAKQNGYLLQAPWHRPSGESFIPLLLPVRANKHMLPVQTGLLTAHPAHRPPTCSPAGYWFKRPHPAVGGVRSFLKEQQTPARKHRPDFSGSWLLHYSAGSSHIPLSKGLAACRQAVLDRTSSCTRLPHPAFFLTLAEAGSSLVLPKSLAVHRCPRVFDARLGLHGGVGSLHALPPPQSANACKKSWGESS